MKKIDFNQYQDAAMATAIYPNRGNNLEYPALGLCGEAGELANKIKKIQRDNLAMVTLRDDLAAELGDVLWYVAAIAEEIGVNLADVAEASLEKLAKRAIRGTLSGSGDNR